MVAALVLVTETFARSLKQGLRVKAAGEQRQARNLERPAALGEIILALERARGEKWVDFQR